jgi:transcriptional regulator with XRE-family HTH domain
MLDFSFATEQEIRIQLGQRLRSQRLLKDISQEELAIRAGISISTIKLIESKGQSTLENFVRVLVALDLAAEMQTLFESKPVSIAMMERMQKVQRMRAPRKSGFAQHKENQP